MKSLTKRDEERRAEIMAKLEIADKAIDDALVEINALIDEKLRPAYEQYNEALTEAEGLRDDIINAIDEYISNRSEKWQEGDKAQAFNEWKSEWEGFDCSPLDVPEALESPDTEHKDTLDGLPAEPSE